MDNPKPVKTTDKTTWTYTDLVTPKGMEGLEVHPHPLKYAVPKYRERGVE